MTEFQTRLTIAAASALAGGIVIYCIDKQIMPVVVAIGVGVAVFGIGMARKTAQQQATLAFMTEYSDSETVSDGVRWIMQMYKEAGMVDFYAENVPPEIAEKLAGIAGKYLLAINAEELMEGREVSSEHPPENKKTKRTQILFVLNKFEVLAIGLEQKIYDRQMIKDCLGRDVARFYNLSKPIIAHIRNNESDSKAFTEFEKLAEEAKNWQ